MRYLLPLLCLMSSAQNRSPVPGAIMPEPLGINAANWHNANFPAIDWTPAGREKWYADPVTGIQLRPVLRPEDFSWSDKNDRTFLHWSGGEGWTNAAAAVNGSTSTAVAGTNPMILYPAPVDPWAGNQMAVMTMGLVVYGYCGGTREDCKLVVCASFHPDEGCAGTPFEVSVPAGTAMKVVPGSAHKYGGSAFPAEYPRPLWAGWGDVRITRDRAVPLTQGTSSRIVDGVLTIDAPGHTIPGHIPRTLKAGHRIWVQDSPCANQICTVDENHDAGSVTLREKFSSQGKQFRPLPWGILVRKKTATGTLYAGFKYRAAGQINSSTGTAGPVCGPIEQVDADGVKGHPCGIPERGGPYYLLYFISNDGSVVRPIAGLTAPPEFGGNFRGQSVSFSPTDGRLFYVKNGSMVYRLRYSGDWKNSVWDTEDGRYRVNPGGDYPYFDEGLKWEVAINPDPATQITEKYPAQVSPPYRPWTSASFAGVTGNVAVLYRTVNGGQDDGPCQIAPFDLVTGKLIDFINSLEAGGPAAWGNCHNVGVNPLVANTLTMSFNILKVNNAAKISGGPYQLRLEAVQRGGAWSTNTCLEWPAGSGTQCSGVPAYDKGCPEGLSDEYTSFGATGDACVTLLLSGNACNVVPAPGDTQIYGACAWNPGYAAAPPLRPGHSFVDPVAGGSAAGDSEHFRVLTVEDAGNGKLKVKAQRNGSRDYCCGTNGTVNPPGNNCVCHNGQLSHKDQWVPMMTPGSKASCNASAIQATYANPEVPDKSFVELSRSFQGHAAYGKGPNGTVRYLGNGVTTLAKFADLGQQPPVKLSRTLTQFNGIAAPIGRIYQQYLNHSQRAGDDTTVFSFDANAVNPSVGIGGNDMGNSIGPRPGKLFERIIGDIWKLSAIDPVDYKNRPLLGWAGPKVLKDVSGPASDISSSQDYTFCYAYKAGECYPGAAQGDIYVKAPLVFKHSSWQNEWCQTGMEYANIPCILSASPVAGYTRQFRSDRSDLDGSDQRLITSALRPYGTHYPFWSITAHPSADLVLVPAGGILEGLHHNMLLASLPPWQDVLPRRNVPGGYTVSLGPGEGKGHARVKFGYTPEFYCTERAEACVTDAALKPFAFVSTDTLTPDECSAGCQIIVPAMPGRQLYTEVERLP